MSICWTLPLHALDVDVDEWIAAVQSSNPTNESLTLLQQIEQSIVDDNNQQLLDQLLTLEQQLKIDETSITFIDLHRLIGELYASRFQQYAEAKIHLKTALDHISKEERPTAYLQTLFWYVHAHYWLFEAQSVTTLSLQGLAFAEQQQNRKYQMLFLQWLGQAFGLEKEWAEAISYYGRMKALADEEKLPDFQLGAQLNTAVALHKSGQSDTAIVVLQTGRPYLEKVPDDTHRKATYLLWEGVILGAVDRFKESEQTLHEVIAIYDSLQIPNRQMHSRIELANVYIKQKKQRTAIQILEEVLQLTPDHITRFERKYVNSLLYRAHRELGNFERAIFHREAVNDVDMELDSINNAQVIKELEKKYKSEQQQQIIAEQESKLAQRRWLAAALLLSLLLLIGMVFAVRRLNRSKQQLTAQNQIIQQQAEELQTLDQLKSNFFVNVSHELRTPLTLILGPISSVLKSNTLDNRNFTLLKKAQQSGQDLKKMISSILDLSKLEANKMELDPQPTLLYDFTKRLAAAFESQADIRHIEYTFQFDVDKDIRISIDQEKFAIIINNLLSNALKFTHSDGHVHFQIQDQGSHIQFTVRDTGRGIHQDDLPHIFDRFYQSKQKTERVEGGTGIGLSLTKEYVKLMGGDLTVESQLDKGSTFRATIAKQEILGVRQDVELADELIASYQTVKVNTTPTPTITDRHLLIVEDNSSLRDYLHTLLSPHYQVTLAANGKKALDHLTVTNRLPDLILSDVMMPEMDGYELLETLKASDNYRGIPVVMLTARADLQDKLKALRIGVDDYMLKPFEEEELLVRLQNLLSNYQIRQNTQQLVLADAAENAPLDVPIISQEDQLWLADVETLLKGQLSNSTYSITQLAGDIALSERQVRRRLKQLVGLSPAQYFKAIRLQHARQLLEQYKYKTVAQTAAAVGFRDAGAFSKAYKAAYGRLPSAYLG
ncbi:MAG: ATP-binding protein [Bacteroidota bacterium]